MRPKSPDPSDRSLEDHRARRLLGVTLACVAASGWDLALALGLVPGLACLAASSLIATALLRLAPRRRSIAAPPAPGWVVFAIGFAAIFVAPAWVTAVDPGSALASVPWRHVLVAATVWPGIGAGVATGLQAVEPSARSLALTMGLPIAALLVWVGETASLAASRGWGLGRIAAAGVLCGLVVGLLVFATMRWIRALLELVRDRSRREAAEAIDRARSEIETALASFEQRIDAIAPLFGRLERDRDARSGDRAHALEVARALGPAASDAIERASLLAGRIEELRRQVEALREAGPARDEGDGDLAHRVESATRGLAAMDQASRAFFDRLARLAAASRESTTSLAELSDASRAVDDASGSIHALSEELVGRAELGRARFAETVAGMEAIRAATRSADGIIRGLDARTREIGGILDVIDDVGDQTSLLALNAAIIAAQAGEHGRAFSVVAEEIRDLADRVLSSTKEIGGLIQSVQTESDRAIGAIEAGSRSVESGVGLAVEVGRILDEIDRISRATSARLASISTSVEKQSRSLDRAVELVSRVDEALREIESADVDRTRRHATAVDTMVGLRDAAGSLRALVLDQMAGLARMDGDLCGALESARGLMAALEGQASAGRGVLRVFEAGGESKPTIDATEAALSAVIEALRFEVGALRARSARADITSTRSSGPARAGGEGS